MQKEFKSEAISFLICSGGILISYWFFGILQEEVTTIEYGPQKEKLNNAQFLVFVQCVANVFAASGVVLFWSSEKNQVPLLEYLPISLTYVGAMFCSNMAIEFIDFPTMVLFKSCKPIPVLLMSVLVLGKRPPLLKWISVSMIVVGISIFQWKQSSNEGNVTNYGLILLAASLAMDGFTGPFQEKLIHKYSPSSYAMMLYINFWSSILLFISLIITNQGEKALEFCTNHSEILIKLFQLSIAGAIGQNFIYYTIQHFGSLTCTIITTCRKFFTILASVIYFGHPLSQMKWFGVAVVFAGLGMDMINVNRRHQKEDKKKDN